MRRPGGCENRHAPAHNTVMARRVRANWRGTQLRCGPTATNHGTKQSQQVNILTDCINLVVRVFENEWLAAAHARPARALPPSLIACWALLGRVGTRGCVDAGRVHGARLFALSSFLSRRTNEGHGGPRSVAVPLPMIGADKSARKRSFGQPVARLSPASSHAQRTSLRRIS
jgi:hypothetical protein